MFVIFSLLIGAVVGVLGESSFGVYARALRAIEIVRGLFKK